MPSHTIAALSLLSEAAACQVLHTGARISRCTCRQSPRSPSMASLVAHSAPPVVQPSCSRPTTWPLECMARFSCTRPMCTSDAARCAACTQRIPARLPAPSPAEGANRWRRCGRFAPSTSPSRHCVRSRKRELVLQVTSPTTVTVSLATPPVLVATVDISVRVSQPDWVREKAECAGRQQAGHEHVPAWAGSGPSRALQQTEQVCHISYF